MCLSCDNLLCDALGRAPSCRLVIFVRNATKLCNEVSRMFYSVPNQSANCYDSSGSSDISRKSLRDSCSKDVTFNHGEEVQKPPAQTNQQISVTTNRQPIWQKYGMTEIVEVRQGPDCFHVLSYFII